VNLEIVKISTLHIGSGSFRLEVMSDGSATLDIFDREVPLSLNDFKIRVSDNFSAKDFTYGAEDRNELLKWLKKELQNL
jgi:hypothetical protein